MAPWTQKTWQYIALDLSTRRGNQSINHTMRGDRLQSKIVGRVIRSKLSLAQIKGVNSSI